MATESTAAPFVVRVTDVAAIQYYLDNAQIGLVAGLAERRPLAVVVLDLRKCDRAPQTALGKVLTFHNFCTAAKTRLAVLVRESPLADAMRESGLDTLVNVCDADSLRTKFGVEIAALGEPPPEPPFEFTEEDRRKMLEDGFTLSDAIREIEPLLRSE